MKNKFIFFFHSFKLYYVLRLHKKLQSRLTSEILDYYLFFVRSHKHFFFFLSFFFLYKSKRPRWSDNIYILREKDWQTNVFRHDSGPSTWGMSRNWNQVSSPFVCLPRGHVSHATVTYSGAHTSHASPKTCDKHTKICKRDVQ